MRKHTLPLPRWQSPLENKALSLVMGKRSAAGRPQVKIMTGQ